MKPEHPERKKELKTVDLGQEFVLSIDGEGGGSFLITSVRGSPVADL